MTDACRKHVRKNENENEGTHICMHQLYQYPERTQINADGVRTAAGWV
jgi:hypothetical protein